MSPVVPELQTARLQLRAFREEDLDAYHRIIAHPEVHRSLHLKDVSRALAWTQMAKFLGQWQLRSTGHWAVVHRASGALIGRAGLHQPERPGWPGVELGWCLAPEHWGQGYATEAGAAAMAWAFGPRGLSELWSCILPENRRSQKVATRLGFRRDRVEVLPHFPSMPHQIWRRRKDDPLP